MILTWHPDAEEEFVEAAAYYEERVDGLGERFISHVEAALARMISAPWMPRCFDGDCRKLRVEKFPYALVYRVQGETLTILAVMHLMRRPGYWRTRESG